MDQVKAAVGAAARAVGDAAWSLRWAGVSLSGRAKAVFVAVAVLLPVLAFGGVYTALHRSEASQPPTGPASATPVAPATQAPVSELQRALDGLGPVTHKAAIDGPKCAAATKRLKVITDGVTATSARRDQLEEVGFQAAVVGRFCEPKDAAKVNRDQLIPFYDVKR